MTPCASSTPCLWHLATGEVFCGLCGQPGATCDLVPEGRATGIVFYPRGGPRHTPTIELQNNGQVPLRVQVRTVGRTYRLAGKEACHNPIVGELIPGAEGKLCVSVGTFGDFPDEIDWVEVSTALGRFQVPVMASDLPSWHVIHERNKKPVGATPIELHPTKSGDLRWKIGVGTHKGTALLTGIRIAGESPSVSLMLPEKLPVLLRPGEHADFWLQMAGGTDPVDVTLEFDAEGLAPTTCPLRIHPLTAVIVQHTIEKPDKDAGESIILGGTRPQKIRLRLANDGSAAASVSKVKFENVGMRVAEVALHPDAKHTCGPDNLLSKAVQAASLPFSPRERKESPALGDTVASWTILVGPAMSVTDGVLRSEMLVDVRAGGVTSKHRVPIEVPARSIRDLPRDEGVLLLDYGTVNTCARLHLNTGGGGQVALEDREDELHIDDPEQLKSVYRVLRWRQKDPELEFGFSLWGKIALHGESTDHAAKLRLVGNRVRYLRDAPGTLRQVTGKDAARTLIREVLSRIASETGFRPRHLVLTSPAAFGDSAREHLRDALVELGFDAGDIEFKLSEPEAYLYALTSAEGSFLEQAQQRWEKQPVERRRKLVGFVFDFGGGTTDVTVFQFRMNGPQPVFEIVASHGYDWLGGERITAQIAAELYKALPEAERLRIRFPEFGSEDVFQIDALNQKSDAMRSNYGELREKAEKWKCDRGRGGRLAENATPTLSTSFELKDEAGKSAPRTADIGAATKSIEQVVPRMIRRALEDTLERIRLMSNWGHVDQVIPQLVAVAGNSGHLWCLEDVIHQQLDGETDKVVYHFDPKIAKKGVLEGLSCAIRGGAEVCRVDRAEVDPHWWYLLVGANFQLAMPAGYRETDTPPSRNPLPKPLSIRNSLDLHQGPGPHEVLSSMEAAKVGMTRTHVVDVPAGLRNSLVTLAMGFRGGTPGLWIRPVRDGVDAAAWAWCPARACGGGG